MLTVNVPTGAFRGVPRQFHHSVLTYLQRSPLSSNHLFFLSMLPSAFLSLLSLLFLSGCLAASSYYSLLGGG